MSLFYNPTIKIARPANSGGHVDGVKSVSPLKSKAVVARGARARKDGGQLDIEGPRLRKDITAKCSVIVREQHEWRRGAVIVRQQAIVGGQLNLFGRD
jgi:hypothetical protein